MLLSGFATTVSANKPAVYPETGGGTFRDSTFNTWATEQTLSNTEIVSVFFVGNSYPTAWWNKSKIDEIKVR